MRNHRGTSAVFPARCSDELLKPKPSESWAFLLPAKSTGLSPSRVAYRPWLFATRGQTGLCLLRSASLRHTSGACSFAIKLPNQLDTTGGQSARTTELYKKSVKLHAKPDTIYLCTAQSKNYLTRFSENASVNLTYFTCKVPWKVHGNQGLARESIEYELNNII